MIETSPTAPGAPPPPAPELGWRGGGRILLGILTTLSLLVMGLFGVIAIMRFSAFSTQFPAHLTAPDHIGNLTRGREAPDAAERELMADRGAFSAVYTAPGRRIFITGHARRILVPDRSLPALPAPDRYEVDSGPVGGHTECAIEAPQVVLCAWADHGSAGVLRFAGWKPIDVPQVLADVREATIVRG